MAPVLFRRNKSRSRDGPGHDVMREKQSTSTQSTASREWWGLKPFLMSNALHILLVFVPAGILTGHMGWNSTAVFVLNMLAILPLAMLLSNATEELAAEAGQVVGALLNATFGNAVEMIVSTVALTRGEIKIVQASMLGAILSNILLCLGCCLFIGGYGHDCHFNATAASTMSSLMVVASTSLIIPAALNLAYDTKIITAVDSLNSILILSRGTAIILLILYIMYLNFQLKTHSSLFEENPDLKTSNAAKESEDQEEATLSPTIAIAVLFGVSLLIATCAEYLVGTIDDVVATLNINRTFIGLIVLPVVGNAAEYVSAIRAAAKGKMSLAIGVSIGSSMQIALFVTPALVILGWVVGEPMSLNFEPFGAIVFFLSVIVVTGLISDGESNYLEGGMLVGTYLIIATAFFVYPGDLSVEELTLPLKASSMP